MEILNNSESHIQNRMVDIVVKSSNPLRTFILQWAEFFKYNPPTLNYISNNKNNQYE